MTDDTSHPELLLHDLFGCSRVLQGVRYNLITKKLIHLFQGFPTSLRVHEDVTGHSHKVESEEEVEELEAHLS